MNNTCSDCRFCDINGYCTLKEKDVNPTSKACSDYEEN